MPKVAKEAFDKIHLLSFSFSFLFLVALGFQLMASHLLGRCSYCLSQLHQPSTSFLDENHQQIRTTEQLCQLDIEHLNKT
jgi:hypothetical protein